MISSGRRQRGKEPCLSIGQQDVVRNAIHDSTPEAWGIEGTVWNRAAIAQFVSRTFRGKRISLSTVTAYRKSWNIERPEPTERRGGRRAHVIGPSVLEVLHELLSLTGVSASSLFSYLSKDPHLCEIFGKKASFYNRLKEANIQAQNRKKREGLGLVNRFCLRVRLLVFRRPKAKDGFTAVLCGYEVETGFINCRVYNVQVSRGKTIANASDADEALPRSRDVEDDTTQHVRFPLPEAEVAHFVAESRRRFSLPLTRLEITQQFQSGLLWHTPLDQALRSPWSTDNKRGDLHVNVEVGTDLIATLCPLPMSTNKLADVLSDWINEHNKRVANPAIAEFNRQIKAELAKVKLTGWQREPKTAELRLLLEFSKKIPVGAKAQHQVRIRPITVECL